MISLSLKRKEGMLERLLGVLMGHVALEIGRCKLLELVLGQVLVVFGSHRDAGNDVAVGDSLKFKQYR